MSDTSPRSPLHAYVHSRFREAFGLPNNTIQKDDHWALQTVIVNRPINVLVNGTPDTPACWVFDPHEVNNQVFSTSLATEDQVDSVIVLIQEKVERAGQTTAKDGSAPNDDGEGASTGDSS